MLARQAELEAELTVACAHHHGTVLLWEVSHTGIKAQVAIVPQCLRQPQELKPSHHAGRVRRGSGVSQKTTLGRRQESRLTSFLETFSCRDLSCRCCSLVTRIHPRSMSDTVYSRDKGWGGGWFGASNQRSKESVQLSLSSLTLSPTLERPLCSESLTISAYKVGRTDCAGALIIF